MNAKEHHGRDDAGRRPGLARSSSRPDGVDEQAAIDALVALVHDKFGEGRSGVDRFGATCGPARVGRPPSRGSEGVSFQAFGLPVSRVSRSGRAVLIASSRVDVAHYFIDEASRGRDRPPAGARDAVAAELGALQARPARPRRRRTLRPAGRAPDAAARRALSDATKHWIRERRYNAEWALSAQLEVLARQFDDMEDEYLRERKADVEQVVERLPRVLARGDRALVPVTRDFASGDPGAGRQRHRARRTCCSSSAACSPGSSRTSAATSHTAIVARSLDIPAVVGRAGGEPADPTGRLGGDRRRRRHRRRQPVADRAGEYRFRQRQIELERERLSPLTAHACGDARR